MHPPSAAYAVADLLGDQVLMYASDFQHGESRFPETVDLFLSLGAEPVGSTPEQFGQHLASETPKLRKVAQVSGMKMAD
jgi:hypothetical protein